VIAVDSNVLLRLFAEPDSPQGRLAFSLIERARRDRETVFVPLVVLLETLWVLARTYRFDKAIRIAILEELFENRVFDLERRDQARFALTLWRSGRADFADYMIALAARDASCTTTYTFDAAAAASPTFTLVAT
jgi:predicted nucleic-acid-binding protein